MKNGTGVAVVVVVAAVVVVDTVLGESSFDLSTTLGTTSEHLPSNHDELWVLGLLLASKFSSIKKSFFFF